MRYTFNIRVKSGPIYWDFIHRTVEADSLKEAEAKAIAAAGPGFIALGSYTVSGAPKTQAMPHSAEVVVKS